MWSSAMFGNVLLFIGQLGPRPGYFHIPAGIVIDVNNRICVADQLNGRAQVFHYLKGALLGWAL